MSRRQTIFVCLIAVAMFIVISVGIYRAYRNEASRARCSQFQTQELAQAYMQAEQAQYLDLDRDGIACERLKIAPGNE